MLARMSDGPERADGPAEPGPVPPRPAPDVPSGGAPRRRRRRPGAFVIVAALLSVPILVTSFTKEPTPEGPVSMAKLRDRYGWEGATLSLFDQVKRYQPAAYAGSGIGTDEGHSGWLGFKEGVPSGAAALLDYYRSDPRNGTVEVIEQLGFTAEEFAARLEAARAAAEALDDVAAAAAAGDPRRGVITLEVTPEQDAAGDREGVEEHVLDAAGEALQVKVERATETSRAAPGVQPVRVVVAGGGPPSASPSEAP